jgi:hypothetical protein
MSFLRSESVATLLRWRETIIGGAVIVAGLYGAATTTGITFYLSLLAAPIGAALVWEGVYRARMPEGGYGPGVVEVDERQITYFAPRGGGSVSVDGLSRVEIVMTERGQFADDYFWALHSDDAPPLTIPGDAVGAGQLYDALLALPGFDPGRILAATRDASPRTSVIWQRPDARLRLS